MTPDDDVTLRTYIEAILGEQRRAIALAEKERERAARLLKEELTRTIAEGDRALRDHIAIQAEQVRAAADAAEVLEQHRMDALNARLDAMASLSAERLEALQREAKVIHDASERAIAKAAEATEKRFESINEWRGQSADREQSHQAESARLSAEYPRREVVDAQLSELRTEVRQLAEKVGKLL